MAYRTIVEVTEFTDAWVEFGVIRKQWGYAAERAPSTHPVAGSPAPDAISALGNFDGISYAKGASVLRQLIAHIGDEAFVAGVVEHLRSHAYGNGDLAPVPRRDGVGVRPLPDRVERGLARDGRCRPARRRRRCADPHPATRRTPPTGRTRSTSPPSRTGARWRGSTSSSTGRAPPFRAWMRCRPVRSSCPTPATSPGRRCRSTPRRSAALPVWLADVPDAQARAVLWVALLGAVSRPRSTRAWRSRCSRTRGPVRRRPRCWRAPRWPCHQPAGPDVPPAARAGGRAGAGGRGRRRAARAVARPSTARRATRWRSSPPGCGRRAERDTEPAAALGGAATASRRVLDGDDDFRWKVLRRLSSLDALSDDEIDDGRGRRPLARRLARGARGAGRAADRGGQGVGLGDAARRRRAVELRGARRWPAGSG